MVPSKRKCKKCGSVIPRCIWVDGEKKTVLNRTLCYKCSPFGFHNKTSVDKLDLLSEEEVWKRDKDRKICFSCKKEFIGKGRLFCPQCTFRNRKKRRIEIVYGITGTACWKCGYDIGENSYKMLDFHHIRDKKFALSAREITNLCWEKVYSEMKKCVLLCCRCHREQLFGIISEEEIFGIFNNKWKEIHSLRSDEELKNIIPKKIKVFQRNEIRQIIKKYCSVCGKKIRHMGLCKDCHGIKQRRVEWPSKEILLACLTNKKSWCSIGRKYGVSDNAVRKWARRYGII